MAVFYGERRGLSSLELHFFHGEGDHHHSSVRCSTGILTQNMPFIVIKFNSMTVCAFDKSIGIKIRLERRCFSLGSANQYADSKIITC